MNANIQKIVVYAIRGLQLLFSILVLGLSAGFLSDIESNFGRVSYNLVVSLFTIVYIVFLGVLLVTLQNTTLPIIILVIESLLTLFWLIAFALTADTFGLIDCFFLSDWCKIGKALIPFGLFNWLLFAASLILFVIYTSVPLGKAHGISGSLTKPTTFSFGAIFSNNIPAPESKEDPIAEENIGVSIYTEEQRESSLEKDEYPSADLGDEGTTLKD